MAALQAVRSKRKRVRRIVAGATAAAVSVLGLGIGFAAPASARSGTSVQGCFSSYGNGNHGNAYNSYGSLSNFEWCP
jgi:hypothetical protein